MNNIGYLVFSILFVLILVVIVSGKLLLWFGESEKSPLMKMLTCWLVWLCLVIVGVMMWM